MQWNNGQDYSKYGFFSSLVAFQYLQLEVFRNSYIKLLNLKYSCGMSYTGHFSLRLFLLCLYSENRYYSKGAWLRILLPNLFVLSASDAVLVVVYLSFLFREMFPLLVFLMPFPGVDRWYNFHLVLLWIFLRNGETILRIEETFGTFGDS